MPSPTRVIRLVSRHRAQFCLHKTGHQTTVFMKFHTQSLLAHLAKQRGRIMGKTNGDSYAKRMQIHAQNECRFMRKRMEIHDIRKTNGDSCAKRMEIHAQNEWRFMRKTNVDSCAKQMQIHAQNECRFMICAKRMDIHAQNEWRFMHKTNGDSCAERMEIHAQSEWTPSNLAIFGTTVVLTWKHENIKLK